MAYSHGFVKETKKGDKNSYINFLEYSYAQE